MRQTANGFLLGLVLVAAVGLFSVAMAAQGPNAEAARVKNPVRASAASIATGQQAYQKFCQFCHGTEGKGDGKLAPKNTTPANLVDATWDNGSSDGEIFANIRDGVSPKFDMKGFKGRLADQDMWNIVNYLRSIGPTAETTR